MSPTRFSSEKVSNALSDYKIPHFLRNKPVLNASTHNNSIRVQTIHTSKGAEAENTAIVILRQADITQLAEDPRLAYVALTRAKERMFPLVIQSGLIGKLQNLNRGDPLMNTFNRMFPGKAKF